MPIWNCEEGQEKELTKLRAYLLQTREDISHQLGFITFVPKFTLITEMPRLCLFKNSHRLAAPRGGGESMWGPIWGIWSWFWSPCSAVNNRKLICLDLFQPVLNYHKMGNRTIRIIETNYHTHTHRRARPRARTHTHCLKHFAPPWQAKKYLISSYHVLSAGFGAVSNAEAGFLCDIQNQCWGN